MSNVKFYALCCKSIPATKRHLRYVPKEDLVIVFNTWDSDYLVEAEAWCQEENIEYYITESDGTASTGKNCFLDIFKQSSNDYAVLIDGDDFITPHGVWTYKQVAQMSNPPDAIALVNQYGIFKERGYSHYLTHKATHSDPFFGVKDILNPDTILGTGTRCFRMAPSWWTSSLAGKNIPKTTETEVALSAVHCRWANHVYRYIDTWETHLRLTWFSKKAANLSYFDTSLKVGEDTYKYLEFKDAHVNGSLSLVHYDDRYPTYVYDTRIDGVVQAVLDEGADGTIGWLTWLTTLTDKYDELESAGRMHETSIPILQVPWPEEYRPDTAGLVNYPGANYIRY